MADPRFYSRSGPRTLGELAALTKSELAPGAPAHFEVRDVAAATDAEPGVIVYADGARVMRTLEGRTGFAVIVKPGNGAQGLPATMLINRAPQRAFATIATHFYPSEGQTLFDLTAGVDPSVKIGARTAIAPSAVIGSNAEIGEDVRIGPNAVIGPGVRIGRNSRIGPNVSIAYALIGDRVTIHGGTAIGQDGFSYIGSPSGHVKVPQLGRVIIQDDVEIGSCSTIDRGALSDTIIGEGTKIDNQVHIAHNCRIGRHAILVGQVGLAGSVTIGDFAVLGGQAGVADHVSIGKGARIAAKSGVLGDVPEGATYAGFPARPRMRWLREVAWVARNVKNRGTAEDKPAGEET